MPLRNPYEIGGYILAGGKSSRMGRDKALLRLCGKPLVVHAVEKLRRVCEEVHILSSNSELGIYASLVPDLRQSCGPLGGIEAGLSHTHFEWNLFMPVDMPFFPSALLDDWISVVVAPERRGTRIAMFSVEGLPQPTLCLLHREVAPFIRAAIEAGRYKLFPVFEEAAQRLAASQGVNLETIFLNIPWKETSGFSIAPEPAALESWQTLTEAQQAAKRLWFTNLNTPEEFAEAAHHIELLDT